MSNDPRNGPLTLRDWERACLSESLRRAGGDVRKVSGLLGEPHPSPVYRKLASHNLGGVSYCAHGKARVGYADQMEFLEVCSSCLGGKTEVAVENRYK
jgi:hypothetical protein